MRKIFLLFPLLFAVFLVPAPAQNFRYDAPFPSVTSQYTTPFLVANTPQTGTPQLAVCNSPANQVPCTNYATTYTSSGAACPNGAQDTPQPQPSNCQSGGDAQGNIGFWAPGGKYDITVCINNNCGNSPYTIVLGGSGTSINLAAPPPIGNITPNLGSFTGLNANGGYSPAVYGAKCDGSTNDITAFNSAITAAATTGGTVLVPASASGCYLAAPLTISANGVSLRGIAWDYGAHQAPSTLLFAAGINGIVSSGDAIRIQDIAIVSKDVGANSDVGLRMTGGRPFLERVLAQSFGSHGFLWDSSTGGNVDHWYANSLRALSNFGDGFRFTGGADENVGTGVDMDASLNGGIGFDLVSGASTNSFITPHASQNTGGDYNIVSGSSNYFLNAYCESGVGPSFTIGAAASFNQVVFPNFGLCSTISNSGGQSNQIYYIYSSSPGVAQLFLNPPPGTAVGSGETYELSSGIFNPKDLDIRDVTGAADLLDFNKSLGGWFALKPWYFANFAAATSAGSTNSGIGGWLSSCYNGSTPQNDFFTTQVIGGSGTNGTARLTHAHIPGCSGYTSEVFQYPFGGKTLIQNAANDFAGSCAMSAGTTCTFALNQGFQSTPLTFVSLDAVSTPPATAISAKCAVSSTTVTITAGASNSLTWDCLLIGNPN